MYMYMYNMDISTHKMLKQYIQPQYSGKLKLFYLHFGITGKLCLVNCPIVIWNSLACKDDQTTAFGTGKFSCIFDFWFWSKSRLRTSTSFSFSFNIKNVSTGLSIYIKIHFSVAGVVLETHLCRATCHQHDAGLEQLLLLLHGLHGRLVWISLRKFTTTPGRGGAGGMLDVFFLWGPWNHKKPMFFTTKTKKVMNGDLIKWLDGLVITFLEQREKQYIYIYI